MRLPTSRFVASEVQHRIDCFTLRTTQYFFRRVRRIQRAKNGKLIATPTTFKADQFHLVLSIGDHSSGWRAAVTPGPRSRIPVCSTTRVKSAMVFSLMVDGSGPRDGPVIFGRFRPVRIVRKRGAIHPSKRRRKRQANRLWVRFGTHLSHRRSRVSISRPHPSQGVQGNRRALRDS
jgi:hypothetical protein